MFFRSAILLMSLIWATMCKNVNTEDEVVLVFAAYNEQPQPKYIASSKVSEKNVYCPDGSYCPDANTCCLQTTLLYGCCLLVNAICCVDRSHCCPSGYTCNPFSFNCSMSSEVLTMLPKLATRPAVMNSVQCPDGSVCPKGNTCCQHPNGQYGCCPEVYAVCCSDHLYCCPNGYTCNTASQTCSRADHVIQWLTKVPAKRAGRTVLFEDGSD